MGEQQSLGNTYVDLLHFTFVSIQFSLLVCRVAANKLNKQSRTADEGWSSILGVGRGANNTSLLKTLLRNTHMRDACSGDNPEVNYSPTRISGGGGVSR